MFEKPRAASWPGGSSCAHCRCAQRCWLRPATRAGGVLSLSPYRGRAVAHRPDSLGIACPQDRRVGPTRSSTLQSFLGHVRRVTRRGDPADARCSSVVPRACSGPDAYTAGRPAWRTRSSPPHGDGHPRRTSSFSWDTHPGTWPVAAPHRSESGVHQTRVRRALALDHRRA